MPDACPHSVGLQTFELGQVANIPTTLQEYLQLAPVNRHLPSDRLSNQILCSQGKLSAPTPIKIFCKQKKKKKKRHAGLILGWEDPLEESLAAHSSIISW